MRAGFTLFRLRGFAIALGDAKSWYQGLCATIGLRPGFLQREPRHPVPGVQRRHAPADPIGCQLDAHITAQSGWHDTITFYQRGEMLDGSGLATGGVRTVGQIGYPICTNHG